MLFSCCFEPSQPLGVTSVQDRLHCKRSQRPFALAENASKPVVKEKEKDTNTQTLVALFFLLGQSLLLSSLYARGLCHKQRRYCVFPSDDKNMSLRREKKLNGEDIARRLPGVNPKNVRILKLRQSRARACVYICPKCWSVGNISVLVVCVWCGGRLVAIAQKVYVTCLPQPCVCGGWACVCVCVCVCARACARACACKNVSRNNCATVDYYSLGKNQ